jgi:outer membrane protein TolC
MSHAITANLLPGGDCHRDSHGRLRSHGPALRCTATARVVHLSEGSPGAGNGSVTVMWRDYYSDPQLQDLIARALESNRDLRAAVLRIRETQALYGIQRADLYPSLGANAFTLRSRTIGSGPDGNTWDFRLTQIGLNLSACATAKHGRCKGWISKSRQGASPD